MRSLSTQRLKERKGHRDFLSYWKKSLRPLRSQRLCVEEGRHHLSTTMLLSAFQSLPVLLQPPREVGYLLRHPLGQRFGREAELLGEVLRGGRLAELVDPELLAEVAR